MNLNHRAFLPNQEGFFRIYVKINKKKFDCITYICIFVWKERTKNSEL